MIREKALEAKIGAFALGGILLLGLVLFNMGELYLKPTYRIRVMFGFTGGLEVGSPVQLAGVPVGEVEHIRIGNDPEGQTLIEVIARIDQAVTIRKNSLVRINAQALLGKKYLEIIPPSGQSEAMARDESIVGRDPVMLEQMTETGERVVQKLEITVDSMNRWLSDEELRLKFRQNMNHSSDLLTDFREVTASLKVILDKVKNGEGTLGKLVTDDSVWVDLKEMVADLKARPWRLIHRDDKKKGLF